MHNLIEHSSNESYVPAKRTQNNKTKQTKRKQPLKVSVIVIKILRRFSPNSEDQFHNAFLWQVNYPTGV